MKKTLRLFLLLLSLIIAVIAAASCGGGHGFVVATDISDGTVTPEAEYNFYLSVLYNGSGAEATVSCNGVILDGGSVHYTANLRDGENVIEVTSEVGGERLERRYTVIRRAEFSIDTDLDKAPIRNDGIEFSAGATFNDAACALIIMQGDTALTGSGGKYAAQLITGENVFRLIARSGNFTEEREIKIDYPGFTFVSDISEQDTADPGYSFRAAARYGEENAGITVSHNGKEVRAVGTKYSLTLFSGENRIVVTLLCGNATNEYSYNVRYIDAAPTLSVNITDGKEYRGSVMSFDVRARDGLGQKLACTSLSFFADWDASDGVDNFVPVKDVAKIWDDSTMTSYRIRFSTGEFSRHTGAPFILKVVATDDYGRTAECRRAMTLIPVEKGGEIGSVVFSLEGFSISCGYFIAPVNIPIYEGVPFSETLISILESHGLEYSYTGTPSSGFYLASISGLDLTGNRIADGIWERVKSSYSRETDVASPLGEFCYGSGSGWMYSVNGVYKNYGFSDYFPTDGDTVRVQFTVLLGEDLGGGGALGLGDGTTMLGDNPDYAHVMHLLADIATLDCDRTVYLASLDALSVWNISNEEMEKQIKLLEETYGSYLKK